MKTIKVLIVDDSVIYRSQIKAALIQMPWIEVMGAASNGKIALEKLEQIPVDLVILDLEMPEIDGIQTLKEIKRRGFHCKVLVFSSASKSGTEITFEALRNGASDFIPKPNGTSLEQRDLEQSTGPSEIIHQLLKPRILAIFPELYQSKKITVAESESKTAPYAKTIWDLFKPKVVVIGSSTGGPTVLEKIFSELTSPLSCPILITQHMPPIFTATLAERIGKLSGIKTYEAHDGQILENAIYVAPGNFHMTLTGEKGALRIQLDQGPLVNSVRPAVDPLFESASKIFKEQCLGIVLTGMGADGRVGSEKIKQLGGTVIIQNEASCIVFGMPGAVYLAQAFDKIMNPDEIICALTEKVASRQGSKSYGT